MVALGLVVSSLSSILEGLRRSVPIEYLFFKAIKTGPRRKINGSWRDKTYIGLCGCASYYILSSCGYQS